MGVSLSCARAFGLAILTMLLSSAAYAAERLHMPFDCRFDGGRVHLRPSDDRAYAVIGRREREIYTACSPSDPGRCRSWFVHRFDLDCGGARVAWLDVAGGAARQGARAAWVEDGQFSIRMGPLWSVARDRRMLAHRRWQREVPPLGAELDELEPGDDVARQPRRIVTLPPGFAPALGVPIAFSGNGEVVREAGPQEPQEPARDTAAAPAAPPAPADAAAAAPAPVAQRAAEPAPESIPGPIPELPQRAPPREEMMRAMAPAVAAVGPSSDAAPAAKATLTQEASPPAPKGGKAAQPADTTPAASAPALPGSIAPTIINATQTAAPPATAPPAPVAPTGAGVVDAQAEARPAPESAPAAATSSPSPPPGAGSMDTAATAFAPADPPAASPPADAMAARRERKATALAASFAILALGGLAAFGMWRWQRRRPDDAAPLLSRDYASVTFDGAHKESLPGTDGTAAADDGSAPAAPKLENDKPTDDLPVPKTYLQALVTLGASPDATVEAIKKIVDGLRRNWHPDHAASESDRAYRERRLQQINVAWDLVTQRRSAA